MDRNFDQALKWLDNHEGGVTNNPKSDRGGLTNRGVTHAEYDHYRAFKGLPLRSVTMIESDEVRDIYYTFYWKVLQCQLLPGGIENAIFDMGVNNGVVGAAKAAQRTANKLSGKAIAVDGHIGPISVNAIDDCDPVQFIDAFCDERLRVDRTFWNWLANGRGWTNRVNGNPHDRNNLLGVRGESKTLASTADRPAKPVVPIQAVVAESFWKRIVSLLAQVFRRA